MSERVEALARRVEADPSFLGSALAVYARAEELDDVELAERLGCSPARLSAIRLCRRPRSAPVQFQHDVDRIAAAFQIDSGVIAEAVRLADALQSVGHVSAEGYLMAARDRALEEDEEDYDAADEP